MPDSLPPRYASLFEPLRIGPVTAPNRFYQVPHCSGMGYGHPETLAAMRAMKAEGGWGVVCTEYCSIHPSSDDRPYPFASLWDDDDIRAQAAMTEAVHRHGSLAGVELWHGGSYVANLHSREATLGADSMPSRGDPVQSARMDLSDIRELRRWHRAAAERAIAAGFDIVYVYPAHGYLLHEFLSRSLNTRGDQYGGSLENRLRLLRELLEETREVVEGRAALAVRFQATGSGEEHLSQAEAREAVAQLAALPDLWDLTVEDYSHEMGSSRFVPQGSLAESVAWVREVTGRPTVTVGRYTSPDEMAALLRRGQADLVGAARPSIADPFLPTKIREGRLEAIRECIGCNVCYSGNARGVPLRCTQNPTMGEEWRRGWHPERVPAGKPESVLVVGSGPAGLEATRILAQRGYRVLLAEAGQALGGRVTRESRLPGLGEWARVRDYRLAQIEGHASVEIYRDSRMTAAEALAAGARHLLLATGARLAPRRARSLACGAGRRLRWRGILHAGRHHGRATAAGRASAAVRRRPLLHGVGAGTGIAAGRAGRHLPHHAGPGRRLGRLHRGAGARPGRLDRGRGDDRSQSRRRRLGARPGRHGLRLHRTAGGGRGCGPGQRHLARAGRCPVAGPCRRPGGAEGRRCGDPGAHR